MNIYTINKFGLAVIVIGLVACSSQPAVVQSKDKAPEILTVYADGTMQFNDRFVNQEDVIIYPDGYGGERAAIKIRVPRHKDSRASRNISRTRRYFYRDSIQVRRVDVDAEKFLVN
jgi:hypothetical protein